MKKVRKRRPPEALGSVRGSIYQRPAQSPTPNENYESLAAVLEIHTLDHSEVRCTQERWGDLSGLFLDRKLFSLEGPEALQLWANIVDQKLQKVIEQATRLQNESRPKNVRSGGRRSRLKAYQQQQQILARETLKDAAEAQEWLQAIRTRIPPDNLFQLAAAAYYLGQVTHRIEVRRFEHEAAIGRNARRSVTTAQKSHRTKTLKRREAKKRDAEAALRAAHKIDPQKAEEIAAKQLKICLRTLRRRLNPPEAAPNANLP